MSETEEAADPSVITAMSIEYILIGTFRKQNRLDNKCFDIIGKNGFLLNHVTIRNIIISRLEYNNLKCEFNKQIPMIIVFYYLFVSS